LFKQDLLLVRPQSGLDGQKEAGHLLLEGILHIIDYRDLGSHFGLLGLGLAEELYQLLPFCGQLLPQGRQLLPMAGKVLLQHLPLLLIQV
jgi:hypothetical protein